VSLLSKRHDVAALVDLGREVGKDCCLSVNIRRQLRLAARESARIKSQLIRPDWNPNHDRQLRDPAVPRKAVVGKDRWLSVNDRRHLPGARWAKVGR
jgi:hypothetical protein